MVAPSKRTKAELQNRLAETERELKLTEKSRDALTKDVERLRKKLSVRESNLSAEVKVANSLRDERDKYLDRYGAIRDRQYTVDIRAQTHYPSDTANAKKFVRGLIDLGIWYFDVGETKK